jgi:glutamyl-tRNA reductase
MVEAPLALLHVHQRDAALDARERAAQALDSAPSDGDWFAISSCHRVEVYALPSVSLDALSSAFPNTTRGDASVARHLFRVACGLDSIVVGERQILGQLRRAHDAARRGALRGELSELLRRALRLGRRVRADGLLRSGRSIGSLAVEDLARRLPSPSLARVLVVGAGEIGALAARSLANRVTRVVIANRDVAKAERLAERVGGNAIGLDRIDAALADIDAVISAADSRGSVLTEPLLRRRLARGPLLVLDIAVPRSVADDARAMPGLTYLTVDDLRDASAPHADVAASEALCAIEAERYAAWRHERAAAPAIRVLRERGEAIRRARLERALAKLRHLDDRDRRVIEGLSAAIVNELLHEPTLALRREPRRVAAALELFGGER